MSLQVEIFLDVDDPDDIVVSPSPTKYIGEDSGISERLIVESELHGTFPAILPK